MDNNTQSASSAPKGGKNTLGIVLAIIILGALLAGGVYAYKNGTATKLGLTPDASVATVNGSKISMKLYTARLDQLRSQYTGQGVDLSQEGAEDALKSQVTETLIDEELLYQYAKEQSVQIPAGRFDEAYAGVKGQFGDEAAYQAELAKQGISDEEFRAVLEKQLVLEALVTKFGGEQNISVSDEEISTFYVAYKESIGAEAAATLPSIEEARPQIELTIKNQKLSDALQKLVTDLRAKATIEKSEA